MVVIAVQLELNLLLMCSYLLSLFDLLFNMDGIFGVFDENEQLRLC
jgi:hypothetical protein